MELFFLLLARETIGSTLLYLIPAGAFSSIILGKSVYIYIFLFIFQ